MDKIKLNVSPQNAIKLDMPVVTIKSHINYHGEACTEMEIKSINLIKKTTKS